MKDPEGKIAKEIKAYLNFRGKQCIIQERQGKESLRSYKYTNANLIPDDTECILVVGGDGTLLQAARDMIERNIPLLGVNKGTLGYLAEVDGDNMEEALDRLIDDNVVIEDRMMLEGCAYSHKKKLLQDFALNDIVIARSGRLQIIFVSATCQCDRHFFNRCHLVKEQSYIVTSLLVGLDLEVGI